MLVLLAAEQVVFLLHGYPAGLVAHHDGGDGDGDDDHGGDDSGDREGRGVSAVRTSQKKVARVTLNLTTQRTFDSCQCESKSKRVPSVNSIDTWVWVLSILHGRRI